jgi:hypothetical protein
MFMKTTEKSISGETQDNHYDGIPTKAIPSNISRLKSLRPQKSMVKVQSFRPRRLTVAAKVSVKKS